MASGDGFHQIVIIGASFGGLPTAHGLLRDVLPALPKPKDKRYKVLLITPSEHFYWMIGAPRAVAAPQNLPLEKLLLPIPDEFKNYSKESFEFIHARAISIDPSTNVVDTSTNQKVRYDSLVIASGLNYTSSAWTISNGLDSLQQDLGQLHRDLKAAKTILISGGGPVGVETAGELVEVFKNEKEITLLSGTSQLLSKLQHKNLGKDAEGYLAQFGVKIVHNLRVDSSDKTEAGQTSLQLSDGSNRLVDVHIDATGGRPNGDFVPEAWLTEKGYVKTDVSTLRLDVETVQNVYCVGSVCSYAVGNSLDSKFAIKPLLESIRLDLLSQGEIGQHGSSIFFGPFSFAPIYSPKIQPPQWDL